MMRQRKLILKQSDQKRRPPADNELHEVQAPSWLLLALESRAAWEFGASMVAAPLLRSVPKGDGHPVLVFPGLVTGDFSTLVLRNYIEQCGYVPYAWEQGLNLGPRPGVIERCVERVQSLRQQHKEPVSLVGWSLGGIYAREISKQIPDDIRMVVTLGTPFAGNPKANNAWRLYEMASGQSIESDLRTEHLHKTPPVPTTSIYSRTDGVVAWRCSVERESERSENIEIHASHLGMCMNPTALYAVADRLAQAHGDWKRFDANGLSGVKKLLYRSAK